MKKKQQQEIITIILIVILFFTAIISSATYLNTNPLASTEKYYNDISKENTYLEPTKAVYNYCKNKDSNLLKVYCVNDYVQDIYYYNTTNKTKNINQILISGGDCKAYSAFYKSVLDMLCIKNKFIFTDNHIFIIAYDNDFYCNLDMHTINCKESTGQ